MKWQFEQNKNVIEIKKTRYDRTGTTTIPYQTLS